MGRPIRIEYPGALYHITSRGNERKEIFREDNDRQRFLDVLADYHDRFGILIHAYVLMDNHYHLVLETPVGNLVKIMHGINSRYTGYFNRKYNRAGHLFQGRYRAILVDKDSYLLALSRYVHLNPIRAGFTKNPEEYHWSSYRGYILKHKEATWMEYDWVLSQFGKHPDRCRKKYQEYVYQGLKGEGQPIFKEIFGQAILGPKKFVDQIQTLFRGQEIDREIPERKYLKKFLKPESILTAVAEFWKKEVADLVVRGTRDDTARKMAIYLSKRYCGSSNLEIGRLFGGMHYSAISKASTRFSKEIEKDDDLKHKMKQIMSNVKT